MSRVLLNDDGGSVRVTEAALFQVIDGAVDTSARVTVDVSRGTGRFDNGVIDGLVNVIGDACYAAGARLRNVQTGYLRSYVLFMVLAAVALFILLFYFAGAAPAQ